jgi:hypothetical protein
LACRGCVTNSDCPFCGQYLTSFKAFGLESVAALQKDVEPADLSDAVEAEEMAVQSTGAVAHLNISSTEAEAKTLLTFQLRQNGRPSLLTLPVQPSFS